MDKDLENVVAESDELSEDELENITGGSCEVDIAQKAAQWISGKIKK